MNLTGNGLATEVLVSFCQGLTWKYCHGGGGGVGNSYPALTRTVLTVTPGEGKAEI